MSLLVSLQQQCTNRLQSDSLFANVPVLTERIGDLQSEINTALGPLGSGATGKTGLVAIVLTPTADVNFDNLFGPFFDDIRIIVRVIENVTVNEDPTTGTNVPASDAAEKFAACCICFSQTTPTAPSWRASRASRSSTIRSISFTNAALKLPAASPAFFRRRHAGHHEHLRHRDAHLRHDGRGHFLHARRQQSLAAQRHALHCALHTRHGPDSQRPRLARRLSHQKHRNRNHMKTINHQLPHH